MARPWLHREDMRPLLGLREGDVHIEVQYTGPDPFTGDDTFLIHQNGAVAVKIDTASDEFWEAAAAANSDESVSRGGGSDVDDEADAAPVRRRPRSRDHGDGDDSDEDLPRNTSGGRGDGRGGGGSSSSYESGSEDDEDGPMTPPPDELENVPLTPTTPIEELGEDDDFVRISPSVSSEEEGPAPETRTNLYEIRMLSPTMVDFNKDSRNWTIRMESPSAANLG